jgi:hypothetical protein
MQQRLSRDEFALAGFLGNEMMRNCEFCVGFEHGTTFAVPVVAC